MAAHPIVVAPGAFLLPKYLSLNAQRDLAGECRGLMEGAVPAYVPVVRGGVRGLEVALTVAPDRTGPSC